MTATSVIHSYYRQRGEQKLRIGEIFLSKDKILAGVEIDSIKIIIYQHVALLQEVDRIDVDGEANAGWNDIFEGGSDQS